VIAVLLLASLASIPADLRFTPWFQERGVAVSIARATTGAPWIRAVGELPAGADRVFDVVTDYAGYRKFFDPAVERAAVLETASREARIHFVWKYPFPFRNRDGVVAYRGERHTDGVFLLSWRDAARPGDPAAGVRIRRIAGETRIEPLAADRCRVTYTYLGDLGGRFPRSLEDKAWRHEPLGYVLAIRRALGLPIPPKTEPLL
jgi:START domain-containing protein